MCEFMKKVPVENGDGNIFDTMCVYDENNIDSCAWKLLMQGCCPTANLSESEKDNKEELCQEQKLN